MADLATLKVGVDSREVKTAAKDLDALGAAAGNAERDVRNVGAAAQSTGSAMRNMTNIIQQGEKAQIAAANANRAVGQTGQLARHHMLNLGFQFQDLGVQIASGQNPLVAFVQQGAQIGGIMQQAQIGIGGVIRALGSMVAAFTMAIVTNPILLGIAAAATVAYVAFKQFQSAVGETGEIKDYANSLGLTKKEMRELENVHVTFGDVLSGVWTTISEGLGLDKVWQSISEFAVQAFDVILKGAGMATAGIYAAFAGSFDAIKVIWKNLPAVLGDLFVQATNSAIGTIEILINAAVNSINFITTKANGVLTSMGMAAVFAQVESVKLGRVANENAGAAAKVTVAVFDAYASRYNEALSGMKSIGLQIKQNTIDATKSRLAAQAAALIEKRNEGKPKKVGLSDEQKQFERDKKAAEDFIKSLEDQAAAIGKTAIQLKEMEIAAKAAAAPTADLRNEIIALGSALVEGLRAEKRKEANKELDKTLKALADEYALLGLTGRAREIAALRMQEEAFKADLLAKGLTNVSAAWLAYYTAEMRLINGQSALDLKQKEAERLKETISGLISLTDELFGGAGSFLANLGGQINIVAPDLQADLKTIFDDLPKNLQDTFSEFLGSLPTVLANARIGQMVGGGAGGAIGGAVGGALGKEFLTKGLQDIGGKVFGKALGSMAGPLGAIAGGVLGGLVGGLLTKTKQGSVTLTQIAGGAMERTLTGNSAQLKGIADNMANGLLKGLGSMAEQLGGTLGGNVKVSLGQRNKDFVVDPTGGGRTKGAGVKNFGTDQAAAVAYVTQLAIQQGIVTGISAGAQTLIRAGNDLNEQVQKALKFDQVFKDLLSETDPLRASLDELSVEMEKLKVIFAEAGASAADYAKLEELYSIKQAKAAFEANRPRRELEIKLMEASGDAAGALAARRKDELAAMNESLRGLQLAIYTYEDLAAANDNVAFAQENLASAIEAQAQKTRELQIQKMREEINGLEQIIAGREEAQRALRAAYDAEVSRIDGEIANRQKNIQSLESAFDAQASVMKGTIDKFRDFATSMREFAASIIPLNATGPASISALRKKFAELAKLAIGGDTGAMGKVTDVGSQLREAITSGATDRVSMLRDLYALQFESEQIAAQAEAQASIAEQQLAILTAQYDAMISAEERAIAQFEADKVALAAQVEQFISLGDKVLTVDAAIKQLQTAEQAALEAEARKADLERQIEALSQVGIDVNEVEKAQRELEKAKAERDKIRDDINKGGFQSVVDAIKNAAASQAAAAQLAAQAQVVAVLPNNVTPFPIMGGGFGAGGGNREFGMNNNIRPFANGGIHSGGLRLVGENGPELEATGPSRIYNSNQLGDMLGERATAAEVKALRDELKLAMYQIAKNTGKSYDIINRWNGDGLPPERIVG